MTKVSLLIDNDVVIKLAQMNVYAIGIRSIGVNVKEVGSLSTMIRFMASRCAALTRSEEEADRLRAAVRSLIEIEPTPEESRLAAAMMKALLLKELDLQEGEVSLMAIALERAGTSIATGDKRALRELPQLAEIFPRLTGLMGRFICFEQIFKKICQKHGLPRVREAVLCSRHADGTLTFTYDRFEQNGQQQFIGALNLLTREQISSVAPNWLMNL